MLMKLIKVFSKRVRNLPHRASVDQSENSRGYRFGISNKTQGSERRENSFLPSAQTVRSLRKLTVMFRNSLSRLGFRWRERVGRRGEEERKRVGRERKRAGENGEREDIVRKRYERYRGAAIVRERGRSLLFLLMQK